MKRSLESNWAKDLSELTENVKQSKSLEVSWRKQKGTGGEKETMVD